MIALARAPSLAEIGEALYGEYWQRPMARDLGKGLRTVHRWAADSSYTPSHAVMRQLVAMLEKREIATLNVLARSRASVAYFDAMRAD